MAPKAAAAKRSSTPGAPKKAATKPEEPPSPVAKASAVDNGTPRKRLSTKVTAPAVDDKTTEKGKSKSLWGSYVRQLSVNPIRTKAISCAFIAYLGDLLTQRGILGQELDYERSARFVVLNLVWCGPMLHFWFAYLARLIPKAGLAGAALRMIPDQLLFSPAFNFATLSGLATLTALEPKACDLTLWWHCQLASWMLWPLVNMLTFWLVPGDLQVLVGNIVGVAWNAWISLTTGRAA